MFFIAALFQVVTTNTHVGPSQDDHHRRSRSRCSCLGSKIYFCERHLSGDVQAVDDGWHENLLHVCLSSTIFSGVIGNALNLCVLLSRHMRSEANYLLSALAIADILLFMTLLPEALGVWKTFYTNDLFRRFYYRSHTMRHWFSNVFSCMATWLILAVSVERYMGISSPMHKRCKWRDSRVRYLLMFLVLGSLFLTAFHHFEYKYGYTTVCNGTLTYAKLVHLEKLVPHISSLQVRIMTVLKVLQIILVVILPLIGVVVLNLKIIIVLRKSSVLVTRSARISSDDHNDDFLCDTDSRQRRDRKVTITVLAIITCFFLTHTPSTLPFIFELISPLMTSQQKEFVRRLMPELGPIVHGWLLTGKVMNFVLFCMSSAFFRRRLLIIIRKRCGCEKHMKKYSVTSGQSTKWQAVRMNTLVYRGSAIRKSSCMTQLD
ncbi:hypothetical protein KIN20_038344 [Parelaphostrongylus tenuis]|uniref:G-protein coupled receptors family 1 profile domain-containing protein n=1 Tax=Parelaphostrongylus tenuis TaxID=148309 RepID=A0AAD5WMG8_PARTN|nr:hypothetical protein KIN20_038344 [Parelaphostrongylus tenuis]